MNSRKKRGRNRGHLRSTWLVSPKENWPQIGKPGNFKLLFKFSLSL